MQEIFAQLENGGSYGLRDGSIVFPIKFYIWMLHFCKNFVNIQILKIFLTKRIFFDQFFEFLNFEETSVIRVFGGAEFETDLKIWVPPFLGALRPIFAGNFVITRER